MLYRHGCQLHNRSMKAARALYADGKQLKKIGVDSNRNKTMLEFQCFSEWKMGFYFPSHNLPAYSHAKTHWYWGENTPKHEAWNPCCSLPSQLLVVLILRFHRSMNKQLIKQIPLKITIHKHIIRHKPLSVVKGHSAFCVRLCYILCNLWCLRERFSEQK